MTDVLSRLIEAEKARLQVGPGSLSDVIYMWNLQDFLRYANGGCPTETCIGVSELVYCSNKYHLRRRYPEVVLAENLYASWASFGRLIHAGVEQLLRSLSFQVEYEVARIIDLGYEKVSVKGRLDAYGMWNDEPTVIEIKSSRGDSELPKQQHILQLRIYMNMVNARQGILLYITPDRLAEYTYTEPISDLELKKLVLETLENKQHPRYDWECSYCPFNQMCPYKKHQNSYSRRR